MRALPDGGNGNEWGVLDEMKAQGTLLFITYRVVHARLGIKADVYTYNIVLKAWMYRQWKRTAVFSEMKPVGCNPIT